MYPHLENIKKIHGQCSIRLPNNIFRTLSKSITNKSGNTNGQQIAFSYAYLATIGFLYKYAHFIDMENESYLQNSDIKELLGYSKTTKSIDRIIKKDGLLDGLLLTESTRNYPIGYKVSHDESINNIPIRNFLMIHDDDDSTLSDLMRAIVKNRNYEIKEPLYMTLGSSESEYGTLYAIEKTHSITIDELLAFINSSELDNIDFLIYGYIKSRCKGYESNMKSMTVYKMVNEIGVDCSTFYKRLPLLKEKQYIAVSHKSWKMKKEGETIKMESNDYYWLGV